MQRRRCFQRHVVVLAVACNTISARSGNKSRRTYFAILGMMVDRTNVRQWKRENVANGMRETMEEALSDRCTQSKGRRFSRHPDCRDQRVAS